MALGCGKTIRPPIGSGVLRHSLPILGATGLWACTGSAPLATFVSPVSPPIMPAHGFDHDRAASRVAGSIGAVSARDQSTSWSWQNGTRDVYVVAVATGRIVRVSENEPWACSGYEDADINGSGTEPAIWFQPDDYPEYQVGYAGALATLAVGSHVQSGDTIGKVSTDERCGANLALTVWTSEGTRVDPFCGQDRADLPDGGRSCATIQLLDDDLFTAP